MKEKYPEFIQLKYRMPIIRFLSKLKKLGILSGKRKEFLQRYLYYGDADIARSRSKETRQRKILIKLGHNKCVHCGSQENLTQDHKIPKRWGGNNTLENKQILCRKCNCKKAHYLIEI